jgi:hypothetical protein
MRALKIALGFCVQSPSSSGTSDVDRKTLFWGTASPDPTRAPFSEAVIRPTDLSIVDLSQFSNTTLQGIKCSSTEAH